MGMGSLNRAISGMNAAQAGLFVTGHNIANSEVRGFSRQRVLQSDARSVTVGFSGNNAMQVGLGVNITGIRHARNSFLDTAFRQEVSRLGFHEVRHSVGREMETIIGELHSSYRAQSVMQDMWISLQTMSVDPTSLENRASFISSSIVFINRVNNIHERTFSEQQRLNSEIVSMVHNINDTVEAIRDLNVRIMNAETSGDFANDFRDLRNIHLDDLSAMLDINISTDPRTGMVNITSGGNELLRGNSVNPIGLRFTSANRNFVEPVFSSSNEILPYEPFTLQFQSTPRLFDFSNPNSSALRNQGGQLKSLLIERGLFPISFNGLPPDPAVPPLNNPFVGIDAHLASLAENIMHSLDQRPVNDTFLTSLIHSSPRSNFNINDPEWIQHLDGLEELRETLYVLSAVTGVHLQLPNMPTRPDSPFSADNQEWIDFYESMINVAKPVIDRATQSARHLLNDISASLLFDPGYPNNPDPEITAHNDIVMHEHRLAVFNATQTGIPVVQREFDTLVNTLIQLINNTFAPAMSTENGYRLCGNAPFGMAGSQGTPIFVRKHFDRFDEDGFLIQEDHRNPYTLYTMGNIQVNPLFNIPSNYELIAHSATGDPSDATLIHGLLDAWTSGIVSIDGGDPMGIESFYRNLVGDIAIRANHAETTANSHLAQLDQADSRRMQLSSVSLDEEMTHMLRFQHAYNASARIFNILDGMLDTIINQM